jgi:4-diphosphocytidyl-2-C-methyl-D-erythritol kinase
MKNKIILDAPAKINLFLEVTGKRPDGYHDIATLFAKLALRDTVELRAKKTPGVAFSLVNKSGCAICAEQDNLAVRAATAVLENCAIKGGVHIKLTKRIPIGAGLGGGSSDAAAVMRGMCMLFGISGEPWKDRKLLRVARGLGADVPVFLYPHSFLIGRGIGEKLVPLSVRGGGEKVFLVYPGVPSPTAEAYRRLIIPERKKSLTKLRALSRLKVMLEGGACPDWENLLFNRLEESVLPHNRSVRSVKKAFLDAGAGAVLMSGSGSCVFSLCVSRAERISIAKLALRKGWTVYNTQTAVGGVSYADQRNSHSHYERGTAQGVRQRHVR